jgi:hypothetical protein
MRKLLFSLLVTVALLLGNQSYAQKGVAINTTGADAANSALLDVSSLTKGVLIPRMTAVQRTAILSPAKGLLVYQEDGTEGFYYFDGTAWTRLSSGTYTETDPVVKAINGVVKSNGTTVSAAVAGTDYLTPTGSAASLTNFPTLNQNTSGTAANVTGIVAVANGGTGATTDAAAFDALSPMTTQGDVIYGGTGGTGTRLAKGTAGQVLTMNSGATAPQWSPPAIGTVTGVTGTSPIISSGGTAPVISLGTVPVAKGGTGSTIQNFVDLSTDQTVAGNKALSGNTTVGGTLTVFGATTLTAATMITTATASQALFTNASKNVVSNPITGTGNVVMSNSPTLVTPTLGVASATSVNGLTPTALATGFTLSGGTVSETLTVPSDATVSGTNTGDNAVNTLYSGLTSNATHTGDAEGATALTVKKINGVELSGLATGILKNTTTTGVPTIAVAGTDYLTPTGSAASLTNFPTLNQNTTGTAANVTGTVAIANGGTGATTDAAAFDALSPMTTEGDVIYGGTGGTGTRLAKGTAGQVLTMNSGATAPEWSAPSAGAVTSVTGTAPISVATGTSTPVISLGTVPITKGGTGATTAIYALNALLPNQFGNDGKFLYTNGAWTSWVSPGNTCFINGGNAFVMTATIGTTDAYGLNFKTNNVNRITIGSTGSVALPAFTTAGVVHNDATTGVLSSSLIVNNDIDAAAGIADTKLATISTDGKVSNSATTATSANTSSAIVSRDLSGNFSAGTITADLTGNATNVTGTVAIANGGTGATTSANAINALLPAQTGNTGKYLITNGSAASWAAAATGTVTNVTGTAPISVATGTTTPAISISAASTSASGNIPRVIDKLETLDRKSVV